MYEKIQIDKTFWAMSLLNCFVNNIGLFKVNPFHNVSVWPIMSLCSRSI